MARAELTPILVSEAGDTTAMKHIGAGFTKISTLGNYILTGGSSQRDASRMILLIQRTTNSSATGYIYIKGGSTAGADDFESGKYTTERDLRLSVATSSLSSIGRTINIIGPLETARFKDSVGYIKVDYSTKLSSKSAAKAACYIAAAFMKT